MLPAVEMPRRIKQPVGAGNRLDHITTAGSAMDLTLYILLMAGEAPIRLKLSFAYRCSEPH